MTPHARTSLHVVALQHEPETRLGAFAALLDEAHIDYALVETLRGSLPQVDADGTIYAS